jgi:hypothetical protein
MIPFDQVHAGSPGAPDKYNPDVRMWHVSTGDGRFARNLCGATRYPAADGTLVTTDGLLAVIAGHNPVTSVAPAVFGRRAPRRVRFCKSCSRCVDVGGGMSLTKYVETLRRLRAVAT